MKKIFFFIIIILWHSTALWSQNWVELAGKEPTQPEITLTNSNSQQVTFTVRLFGFFSNQKTEAGIIYQRLSIPGYGVSGAVGKPEIPVIKQCIAIPECSNISCSVQIMASDSLSNYFVYPVPNLQFINNVWKEIFTIDSSAYQTNTYFPAKYYSVSEKGLMRNQRFVVLDIYPIQFNPATKKLQVVTEMEVTLTFDNPTTDVNVNVGIFNNVATHTFLNFHDQGISASTNDKAFEKKNFTRGSVQWITLTDTAQAKNIVADYVIICASSFFSSHCSEVQRIAEHRAYYNGFDVVILNEWNITSNGLGFYYEGESIGDDKFKKEQRIRTCIRRIYEGKNAVHTHDGYLGYVLLIGDDALKPGDDLYPNGSFGVRTSREYGGDGVSDYYYSCVTRNSDGSYDKKGDLFIGRFCVAPNFTNGLEELHNMVEKTIRFETEYCFDDWRNKVHAVNGTIQSSAYWDKFYPFLETVINEHELQFVNLFNQDPNDFANSVVNLLNNGASLFLINAHGEAEYWEQGLSATLLKDFLTNIGETPFCFANSCLVGSFHTHKCVAQQTTSYSSDKGFVAMIASSIAIPSLPLDTIITDPPGRFFERVPYIIYQQHSNIAGEIFLNIFPHIGESSFFRVFNLLGDPALNVIAEGFEVTQDVIADCKIALSTPVYIRNGATVTISCELMCTENASIIVAPGGKLIIDGGKITNASEGKMWQGIKVYGNTIHSLPTGQLPNGIVEIRNGGIIENAVIGLHATNGGIVNASNAHFINNTVAAHIDFLSKANFTNLLFTINNNYLGNPLNFETLLKLTDSELITVLECSFLNANSQIPANFSYVNNIGIKAFNSHLFCSKSSFSGFSTGVSANNSGSIPSLHIRDCSFNNSLYGIRIDGINYLQLIRNNFNLSLSGCGVSVANSTGYVIHENNFYGLNSIAIHSAVGLSIHNSGTMENEVYKNFYQNLNVAQKFTGINAAQYSQNGKLSGLQTICNTFQNSKYSNINVGALPFEPSFQNNYIRKIQGTSLKSAGNLFYGTPVLDISNTLSPYIMDYYFNPFANYEYPTQTTNVTTYKANANNCPSKIKSAAQIKEGGSDDFENAYAQYDEWNSLFEYWVAQLVAFQGGEDEEEYKIILNHVAYFSSQKDNFWNLFIATTMNEEEVEDSKEIKGYKKTKNLRNLFKYHGNNTVNISIAETYIAENNYDDAQVTLDKRISDEWSSLYETLRYLFNYRGQYGDYISLVEAFLAERNYSEVLTTIATIYEKFKITEEQVFELSGLQTYTHWLQQLENTEKNIFRLSEKEIEYLVNFVKVGTGRGVVFANNILCALYNICLEEENGGENTDGGIQKVENDEEGEYSNGLTLLQSYALDNIKLIPNPTTGELRIVSGELQVDKIDVLDIYGRNLLSNQIITKSSNHKIDISHLSAGIYFVRISTESGEVVRKVLKE